VHDGAIWGRGAIDMKSQTAAEAVAAAHLARSGWRPERGELKLISVADEETGGRLGAQWLTEERPDAARVDWLLNEGGGAVMPYGGRRLYGVCCAEKGTFRFRVTAHGAAGHASVPGVADNALLKLAPVLTRLAAAKAPYDLTEEPRAFLKAIGEDPGDPEGAIARIAAADPRLVAMLEPAMQVTFAPTQISASEKINVIPARAELRVDCRAPAGMAPADVLARVQEALGGDTEFEFTEQVVGNRSPIRTPLMAAIESWLGEVEPEAEAVPVVLPAFTDSRWWRDAFPECVAYGFFPMRHTDLYGWWPLLHAADERIDVRDLAFATEFFAWLPPTLLT
jgi:acetylornithine deacetylase/succinyl-diaminopimelate desuccinylase-like protein